VNAAQALVSAKERPATRRASASPSGVLGYRRSGSSIQHCAALSACAGDPTASGRCGSPPPLRKWWNMNISAVVPSLSSTGHRAPTTAPAPAASSAVVSVIDSSCCARVRSLPQSTSTIRPPGAAGSRRWAPESNCSTVTIRRGSPLSSTSSESAAVAPAAAWQLAISSAALEAPCPGNNGNKDSTEVEGRGYDWTGPASASSLDNAPTTVQCG